MVFTSAQAATLLASSVACPRCGVAGGAGPTSARLCVLSPFDQQSYNQGQTFHYARFLAVTAPPANQDIVGLW